jgi:hypothetical protein
MSLIEMFTIGPIFVTIGIGMLLCNGKVLSWVSTSVPQPPGSGGQNGVPVALPPQTCVFGILY